MAAAPALLAAVFEHGPGAPIPEDGEQQSPLSGGNLGPRLAAALAQARDARPFAMP